MDRLPSELLLQLLIDVSHLPSVINFSVTSKKFYEFVHYYYHPQQRLFWKKIFQQQQIQDPSYFNVDFSAYYDTRTPTAGNTATSEEDWKTIVKNIYCLKNNWKNAKAIVSKLPGKAFCTHLRTSRSIDTI